ncbi:MAG: glycosyltransferase [Bacteroidetes bacterium]|nr:MAG: glycosyltransferase [Bacteroidota bacterium]
MNKSPLLSVVMPAYNEEQKVLNRSIVSILNQTFQDYEFIIVLDNPQNYDAIALINDFKNDDDRIKLIINDKNLGVAPTLNIGVNASFGDFIARQDADDESTSHRFEKQIKFLNSNPDINVLGTAMDYVDEHGKIIFCRKYQNRPDKFIRKYNPLGHPTLMIRKEIFEKFGYYSENEQFKFVEDYELWFRWYLSGVRFFNLDESLYKYYQNRTNIKSRNTKLQLRNTIKLKNKYRLDLKFRISDYLRLFGEKILTLLPSGLISWLFYKLSKI